MDLSSDLSDKTLFLNTEDTDADEDIQQSKRKFPKRSTFQLFKMCSINFGIAILFSIEIALSVPILLKLHVAENVYSYFYFVSPLLGFLLQPMLGLMSDRCESSFGRRRPFILTLSLSAFVGLALILNESFFGEWSAVILVGVGMTLLDFSVDSCDTPLRAFLLDTCNPDDQDLAFNIHAFLSGIGASFGYILTSVEWHTPFLGIYGKLEYPQDIFFYIIYTVFFSF